MATLAIQIPRKWQELPTGPVELNPYWLSRGLTRLYLLRAGEWFFDQVTRSVLGTVVGTGALLRGDHIETTGNNTNYMRLPLGVLVHTGCTLVTAQTVVSGSVPWSVLSEADDAWYGLYSGATSNARTVFNNTFDGLISGAGTRGRFSVNAITYAGSDLRGCFSGSQITVDSSLTAPSISNTTMTLGLSRRATGRDNESVSQIQLVASASLNWSAGELQAVSAAPYGELLRRRPLRTFFDLTVAPPAGSSTWYYQMLRR